MKLTVSAVQIHPEDGQIDQNLSKAGLFVFKAKEAGAKLVLLPEICDRPYNTSKFAASAEKFPSRTFEHFSKLSKKYSIAIAAGMMHKKEEKLYNSLVIFNSKGECAGEYNKSHLCPYQPFNEPAIFEKGEKISTVEVDGIKVGLSICYDIRFPELYRKMALDGAQIILVSAAFPKIRIDHLETCARSRAIENQLFMVVANQCGYVGNIELGGNSMIIGPFGEIRTSAGSNEKFISSTIDLSEIETIRREKPVFTQRRTDLY